MPTMELPPELAVPSCGRCKEPHLDRMEQDALVQQLRDTYTRSLQGRARIALDALRQHVSGRRLEMTLGLSQGYLSRLRARAGNPSSELVALLALLAMDPSLLNELERFWAMPDASWQPLGWNATSTSRRGRRQPGSRRTERNLAEIRDRTDIVSVIGQYVNLLRNGADYFGACPFHEYKDASFRVSVSKQFYYCFGCQRSGDVIRFLCEKENRTQADVPSDLARRAGINE